MSIDGPWRNQAGRFWRSLKQTDVPWPLLIAYSLFLDQDRPGVMTCPAVAVRRRLITTGTRVSMTSGVSDMQASTESADQPS